MRWIRWTSVCVWLSCAKVPFVASKAQHTDRIIWYGDCNRLCSLLLVLYAYLHENSRLATRNWFCDSVSSVTIVWLTSSMWIWSQIYSFNSLFFLFFSLFPTATTMMKTHNSNFIWHFVCSFLFRVCVNFFWMDKSTLFHVFNTNFRMNRN